MKRLVTMMVAVLAFASCAHAGIVFTDGFEGAAVSPNPYTVAEQFADAGKRTDSDPETYPAGTVAPTYGSVDETLLYMAQVTNAAPMGAHSGDNALRLHRSVYGGATQQGAYYVWPQLTEKDEMNVEFWMSADDVVESGGGIAYMTVCNSVGVDSINLGLHGDGSVIYWNGGAWTPTGDTYNVSSEWVKFNLTYTPHDPTITFAINDGTPMTVTTYGNPNTHDVWRLRFFAYNIETFVDDLSVDIVPEPATMSLLGLGLVGLLRRKR